MRSRPLGYRTYTSSVNTMPPCIPQAWPGCAQVPKTTAIYALIDPRTRTVRYVGKSDNPEYRLSQHCRAEQYTNPKLRAWVLDLRGRGLVPAMEVMERPRKARWMERERAWIKHYRMMSGGTLLNIEDGGAYRRFADGSKAKLYDSSRQAREPTTLTVDSFFRRGWCSKHRSSRACCSCA